MPDGSVATDSGWNLDQIAFYVYANADAGLLPIRAFYIDQPAYSYYLGCDPNLYLPAPSGWQPAAWGPNQTFYALPGNVTLSYGFQNLNFANVQLPKGQPSVMSTQVVNNQSGSSTASTSVTFSTSNTATLTLSLTETIGVSDAVTAEAGIPGLADAKETTTVSINIGSTQQISTQVQQAITVSGTVTVPPGGSVTATGIMYVAQNVEIPFSLQCLVTAQMFNHNIGSASQGPCTALTDLFLQKNPNFKGQVSSAPSLNGITVTMAGILTGTYAITAELDVKDNPVGQSDTDANRGAASVSNVTRQIAINPKTTAATART